MFNRFKSSRRGSYSPLRAAREADIPSAEQPQGSDELSQTITDPLSNSLQSMVTLFENASEQLKLTKNALKITSQQAPQNNGAVTHVQSFIMQRMARDMDTMRSLGQRILTDNSEDNSNLNLLTSLTSRYLQCLNNLPIKSDRSSTMPLHNDTSSIDIDPPSSMPSRYYSDMMSRYDIRLGQDNGSFYSLLYSPYNVNTTPQPDPTNPQHPINQIIRIHSGLQENSGYQNLLKQLLEFDQQILFIQGMIKIDPEHSADLIASSG